MTPIAECLLEHVLGRLNDLKRLSKGVLQALENVRVAEDGSTGKIFLNAGYAACIGYALARAAVDNKDTFDGKAVLRSRLEELDGLSPEVRQLIAAEVASRINAEAQPQIQSLQPRLEEIMSQPPAKRLCE